MLTTSNLPAISDDAPLLIAMRESREREARDLQQQANTARALPALRALVRSYMQPLPGLYVPVPNKNSPVAAGTAASYYTVLLQAETPRICGSSDIDEFVTLCDVLGIDAAGTFE